MGGRGFRVVTITVILVDKAGILNFQHYRNKAPLTKNLPQMPRAPLRNTINTLPFSHRPGKGRLQSLVTHSRSQSYFPFCLTAQKLPQEVYSKYRREILRDHFSIIPLEANNL